MAGFGGQVRLSVAQQDSAIGDLLPALLCGEKSLGKSEEVDQQENGEIGAIRQELLRCVSDIQNLLQEVEEGHNRLSSLTPEDVVWMVEYLTAEVKRLESKMRTALAVCRGRSRVR